MPWGAIKPTKATRASSPNTDVACRGKAIAATLLVVDGAMVVGLFGAVLQQTGRPQARGGREYASACCLRLAAVPVCVMMGWRGRKGGE